MEEKKGILRGVILGVLISLLHFLLMFLPIDNFLFLFYSMVFIPFILVIVGIIVLIQKRNRLAMTLIFLGLTMWIMDILAIFVIFLICSGILFFKL